MNHSKSFLDFEKPKSLNIRQRKKENDRIERENFAFAKRLYNNQGFIKKKEMEAHYQEMQKIKQRISKVKKHRPIFNGRFEALPPLKENSISAAVSRNFKSDGKKDDAKLDSIQDVPKEEPKLETTIS
jgi:hypothetical protein